MRDVDWRILPQTREAQLARFVAKLNAIAAQKRADAIDPRFAALRAAADLQDALRNESYREGLGCEGMSEALEAGRIHWSNKRNTA